MTARCIITQRRHIIANHSQFPRNSPGVARKGGGGRGGRTDEGTMDVPIWVAIGLLIVVALIYFIKGFKQKREQDRNDD